MKGGNRPQGFNGYTIVEVMIVLAVSGVMFIIAANFVSGKQARTAFTQGTNAMAGNIQSMIESVIDGQYTDIPFQCAVGSGTPRVLTFSNPSATSAQGTNQDCTFLGILMQFHTVQPSSDPLSNYNQVYLAGAKTTSTGAPLTDIAHSAITAISAAHSGNTINLKKPFTVPQNLQVTGVKVIYTNGGTTQTDTDHFNFGIIQGFGTADTADANLYQTGAQSVGLIVDEGVAINSSDLNETNVFSANSAIICLTDGSRKSQVTVGGNGNQLKATANFSGLDALCA